MRLLLIVALLVASWGLSYANPERTFDLPGGTTMEMVWIEPGTFTMGTTKEQELLLRSKELWQDYFVNEQPAHQVTISRGFWLGKHEITQGQWSTAMGNKPWRK
jgi:formylglycine-generating enzyme required for sulfatase activity